MQRRSFAAAGLLAIGMCIGGSSPAAAQGYPGATAPQIRACRSEADRRLPDYNFDQITAESESRDQNVAVVRWSAGGTVSGTCTVATNGRLLGFTRDKNFGGGDYAGPSTRVTCESKRTERQECRIPPGSRIRLVRQISDNPCRPNDTYGQGQGYLWVAEGCRAEFEVTTPSYGEAGGPGGGGSTRLTCSSPINGRQECPLPAGTVAKFVSQVGNRPCRLNVTYGFKPGFAWVQQGCQAVFEITGRGEQGGNTGSYTTRLTCESEGTARQQCPIAGATSIRLVRQISTNPCRLNQTYGIGFGHVWVSNGCRGEFEVTVGGAQARPPYYRPGTGLSTRLTCESSNGQRNECRIRNGAQVQLVKQLSSSACVRNSSWGTGYGVLWVDKGCRGEFEVR
jgi:Protein of unknown function (DUF3011)